MELLKINILCGFCKNSVVNDFIDEGDESFQKYLLHAYIFKMFAQVLTL